MIPQDPPDDEILVLAHVAGREIEDLGGVVGRGQQAPVAEEGEERFEGVGEPAEGEADRDEGPARGAGEGLLDDVAADQEQEGEDVGRVAPLRGELVGGAPRRGVRRGSADQARHGVWGAAEPRDHAQNGHFGGAGLLTRWGVDLIRASRPWFRVAEVR